jgi:hypothetical protein
MERLKHRAADDAVARVAARLIRASAVDEPPVGLEQRIRARLSSARPRRARVRLAPALAIVLVLVLVGVATAAHRWIRRAPPATVHPLAIPQHAPTTTTPTPTPTPTPPPPATDPAPNAPMTRAESPATAPRLLPTMPRHAPTLPARAADSEPDDVPAATATAPPAPAAALAPAASATVNVVTAPPARTLAPERTRSDTSESRLVLDGATALRRRHDPVAAIKLLDQYLRRYPDGVLIEEGLALAIEAYSIRGDRKAAALANDYLRRFPSGRFHDEAKRALERFNRDR